ncbi:hypothetical protein B0A52_09035 [Exophiala mesophila]|uniref:Uncharacterized protein n=1 Tax=Exophiala mesophila TaxID=212818 RepID=A0A438MVN0_EXOME|nr:hypothetical protein B0A52_09035 [Exophiala mesophila]
MIYSGYYNLKKAQIDAENKTKKFFKKALEQLKPLPPDQIQEPDTFYGPIIRKGPLFVHH